MVPDGKYKVYGANGVIGRYDKYNHEKSEILVTCRGATCGSINISEEKSWINGNAMVVHPKDESVILKDYLYFLLKGINLSSTISGSAQPQITRTTLYPVEIPLPPVVKQKKIVAKLEKLFGKIKEAERLRAEAEITAKNLLSAELHKIFSEGKKKGWEEKKLGDLINTITPPIKIQKKNFKQSGNYPVIDQSQDEIAGWTDDVDSIVNIKKPVVIFGDHTCAVKYSEKPFTQGADGIKILTTDDNLLPKFLYLILKNQPIKSEGYRRHFYKLKELKIILPPILEQKKIVARLDALSAKAHELQTLQSQTAQNLKELKQSILHKSFKGQL